MTSTLWARERLERERIHKRSDVSPVFLGAWRALKENRYIHKDTEMYDRSFWAHDESPVEKNAQRDGRRTSASKENTSRCMTGG